MKDCARCTRNKSLWYYYLCEGIRKKVGKPGTLHMPGVISVNKIIIKVSHKQCPEMFP